MLKWKRGALMKVNKVRVCHAKHKIAKATKKVTRGNVRVMVQEPRMIALMRIRCKTVVAMKAFIRAQEILWRRARSNQ